MDDKLEIATPANGCFWCSEAIFKRLKGVKSVLLGYSGGIVKNPSYDQVCTGKTGHAAFVDDKLPSQYCEFQSLLAYDRLVRSN
jgi:peptide-methionine (S)-S-oxide reductase